MQHLQGEDAPSHHGWGWGRLGLGGVGGGGKVTQLVRSTLPMAGGAPAAYCTLLQHACLLPPEAAADESLTCLATSCLQQPHLS
jgi:hypothetical protein